MGLLHICNSPVLMQYTLLSLCYSQGRENNTFLVLHVVCFALSDGIGAALCYIKITGILQIYSIPVRFISSTF